MDLEELIKFILRMIANNTKHQDYDRVKELAEEYKILTTGKNIGFLLKRYIRRESAEEYALRCLMTNAITPAVAASIKNPFYKVIRNDRIKRGLKLGSPRGEEKVKGMIESFYGSARSTNKGLDHWLKTRAFDLTFIDPNAWIAVEWIAVKPSEVPKPYPFVIKAANALNFSVINDEIKWLFCDQDITFPESKDPAVKEKVGKKYTFYGQDYTITVAQVEPKYLKATGFVLASNQRIEKMKSGSLAFLITWTQPKIGYPPVFRIGYKTDDVTESRTFVVPWHDAMCYFQKTLKEVSEFDLTMAGHVFPQKIQYAPECPGNERQKCKKGVLMDGTLCDTCKGSGFLTHSAANDVIYIPLPDNAEDAWDLDKLLVYKAPPIELIKFQNEHILQLKSEAHEAVFNSQQFVKKQNNGSGGEIQQTATEIDTNMQSIYDTLEAYTEKVSELYRDIVTVFAIMVNEKPKNIKVIHSFPADFKLKTQDMLLADLKAANESGAPSFLRDAINYDLAEITYAGDEIGLDKYRVQRKFFPFNGKTQDDILQLMSSAYVSKREKILYANFSAIFTEIESERPDFYTIEAYEEQYPIVEAKIQEWAAALQLETPTLSIDQLKAAAADPGTNEEETPAE